MEEGVVRGEDNILKINQGIQAFSLQSSLILILSGVLKMSVCNVSTGKSLPVSHHELVRLRN